MELIKEAGFNVGISRRNGNMSLVVYSLLSDCVVQRKKSCYFRLLPFGASAATTTFALHLSLLYFVQKSYSLPPDRKVSPFFGAQRIPIEVSNDNVFEITGGVYSELDHWICVAFCGFKTNGSTLKIRFDRGDNLFFVCPHVYLKNRPKIATWVFANSRPFVGEHKRPLAIDEPR